MEIIKNIEYNKEDVISKAKFVINRIIPLAIKPIDHNTFMILLLATQDYDDSFIYLQVPFICEDDELYYFNNHELNLDKLEEEPLSANYQGYKNSIKFMNKGNIYVTDFSFDENVRGIHYFHSESIRVVDDNHLIIMDLYIPFDNFIKLTLFLKNIKIIDLETVFISGKYHNMNLVDIEVLKLDCSTENGNGNISKYTTHYTMNCGPSEFRMNHTIIDSSNKILKEPLDNSIYNATYLNDNTVDDYFVFNNNLFILYKNFVNKTFRGIKVLRLKPELVKRTNFVDESNIFVKGE